MDTRFVVQSNKQNTVEPRYNEPIYNEDRCTLDDILQPIGPVVVVQ